MPVESEMNFRRQPKPVEIHILGGDKEDRVQMLRMLLGKLANEWGNADTQHHPDAEMIHWHPNAMND